MTFAKFMKSGLEKEKELRVQLHYRINALFWEA